MILNEGGKMEELHKKYRPKTLDEVVGNKVAVSTIRAIMAKPKENISQAWLFQGPPGTGKTTLQRILKTDLECTDMNFHEINSARFTGIDTVRAIQDNAQMGSLQSGSRIYMLDECFSSETRIRTKNGTKRIDTIKKGDFVFSLKGEDEVTQVFKNKVSLDRVVKVSFDNGSILFTTKEHLFFTLEGWKKAETLTKKDLILCFPSYMLLSRELHKEEENGKEKSDKDLLVVWKKILFYREEAREKKICKNEDLFQTVCKEITGQRRRYWVESIKSVPNMWSRVFSSKTKNSHKNNLWKKMWGCFSWKNPDGKEEIRRSQKKNFFGNSRRTQEEPQLGETNFRENEKEKSCSRPQSGAKDIRNKKNKWNSAYMEWKAWWEWSINRTTNFVIHCFGMENRSTYINGSLPTLRPSRIPHKLQSRHWESKTENSNRSGWKGTSEKTKERIGSEERKETVGVRLENIEIYKQGDNDKSFESVIGNKERNQKFVEFFDLEIKNNPSYFAENIAVHNCHQFSKSAQDSLLKILEDTPRNIFFFLGTTNPEKLAKALISRCTIITTSYLTTKESSALVKKVIKKETKEEFPEDVVKEIVRASQGSPRDALKILDTVITMEDFDEMIQAIKDGTIVGDESELAELCRMLLKFNQHKWKEVVPILQGLKGDAENVRRGILGYMSKVLLSSGSEVAAEIIQHFRNNYYDSGMPGLIADCFDVFSQK